MENAPDATTISVNRARRVRENYIVERIFEEILQQIAARGLVGGNIPYTVSAPLKGKVEQT